MVLTVMWQCPGASPRVMAGYSNYTVFTSIPRLSLACSARQCHVPAAGGARGGGGARRGGGPALSVPGASPVLRPERV